MTERARFITSVRSGFGRTMPEQLLTRGDRVAGTLRTSGALDDLKVKHSDLLWLANLDVTDTCGDPTVTLSGCDCGSVETMSLGSAASAREHASRGAATRQQLASSTPSLIGMADRRNIGCTAAVSETIAWRRIWVAPRGRGTSLVTVLVTAARLPSPSTRMPPS